MPCCANYEVYITNIKCRESSFQTKCSKFSLSELPEKICTLDIIFYSKINNHIRLWATLSLKNDQTSLDRYQSPPCLIFQVKQIHVSIHSLGEDDTASFTRHHFNAPYSSILDLVLDQTHVYPEKLFLRK